MPYHDSPSPARRSQLSERTSSMQSLQRSSPTAGHPSKGSAQKLHKAHPVGHHRHAHGRVPSYGKNLNKLSKLTAIRPVDDSSESTGHTNAKSQIPSSSPTSQQIKRNSSNNSNVSLPRAGSKVSFKKNSSNTSLKHNGSAANLANAAKPHIKPHSRNGSAHNLPSKVKVQFSVGSDDQDDEWVEASSSQSPSTTRHSPNNSKTLQLEEPPSPDEPAGRPHQTLPHSPPQSPPTHGSKAPNNGSTEHRPGHSIQYSHPPDAEVVTHRLLNRHNPNNAAPQMSSVSATITPSGSSGSPAFNHGHDSTLPSDPSMPADGISRFLNHTGSSSGSATPGSISQLQSTLAQIHRNQHRPQAQHPFSPSSNSPPTKGALEVSKRTKSAGNLTHSRLSSNENHSASPPSPVQPTAPYNSRASPFKSARDPREAGKSLTQLKLDLQRMSTNREPAHAPAVQPPLAMMHGAHAVAGLGAANGERSGERRIRQWDQADLEYKNGRRFNNMLVSAVGRLEKQREKKKVLIRAPREEASKAAGDLNGTVMRAAGSRPGSRGRVRFEVGRREGEEEEEEENNEDGMPGLLKRMWDSNGPEIGD